MPVDKMLLLQGQILTLLVRCTLMLGASKQPLKTDILNSRFGFNTGDDGTIALTQRPLTWFALVI